MNKWEKTKDYRIKRRAGTYWARFMKKGRTVETTLNTKSFEIAKHKVDEIEGKILAGRSWKMERQLFEDAWIEFLKDKKEGNKVRSVRSKTLYEYTSFGERLFVPFFGKMRLGDIDDQAWIDFIAWVKKSRGDIQFFNIRKYFSGFLTWAKVHKKIMDPPYLFDPDARTNREKEEYSPGKAYTLAELKDIRDAAKKHGRFYLFALMAQYMGMRPSEITQLKKDRIDLEAFVITLKKVDTKTGIGRVVPIHPVVREALLKQMQASHSDYLFPNQRIHVRPNEPMDRTGFKKVWNAILEEAGLSGRIYDFRHTFITHAVKSGVNPAAVAMMTGTSLKVMQKHYLHLSPTDLNDELTRLKL